MPRHVTAHVEAGSAAPRSLGSLAARNATAAFGGRGSALLVSLILTPFLLGKLGRDVYGVLAATGAAFEYLVLLRAGLGEAMYRHVAIKLHTGQADEARRYYAAGFWWGFLVRVPILVAGLLLAAPLCRFIRVPAEYLPDAVSGVALLMVGAVVADMAHVFSVPTYVTGRTAPLSGIQAASPIVRLLLALLAFSLLVPSLTLYAVVLILVQLLALAATAVLGHFSRVVGSVFPKPSLGSREMRRELFSYGGLAVLAQAASLLYVTTDNLLIGQFYGTAAVTFYSFGARWMPLVRGALSAMIRPLAPLFTQLEGTGEEERSRRGLRRAVAAAAAMAVPVCLVPCVLGDIFLTHWVGAEYRGAWVIMIASLAPMTLDIALFPVWAALAGRGRIGWIAVGEVLVALMNVAVSLLLALAAGLGVLGFALGNTTALLARNLLLRPLAGRRETSIPPMSSLFGELLRALAGGAPALIGLYLLRGLYSGSLAAVVAAGIVGGALCLTGSSLAAVGLPTLRRLFRAIVPSARGAGRA